MDHPSIITIMTLPSQTTFIFIQPIIIILLLVMYISYTTYYISFCTFILLLTNIVHVLLSLGKDYTFGLVRNILSLPTQQNTLQAIKQHDRFIVMCGLQYRIKIYRFVHLELYMLRISGRRDKTNYCFEM